MISSRQIILFFSLFLMLGFSGWLYIHFQNQENQQVVHKKQSLDASAKNIAITNFDDEGTIKNILSAADVKHFPKQNKSHFTKPLITIYVKKQSPWTIRSNSGDALRGNQEIQFYGEVHLHQAKSKNNEETTIDTEQLTFFPKKHFATTQKAITLKKPGLTISAIGMHAYLNDDRVELLSNVHGRYQHA